MTDALNNYRKAFDALLPEINANIEKYRKGNFNIKVLNENGAPIPSTVTVEQKGHKFDFGTNVLMLGAMGDKELEYQNAITNICNLVTTTFCWRDTETSEGKFRFDEGVEDIYRRPPAERVFKFAQENNLRAKGQPLLADSWVPEWASKDKNEFKRQCTNFFKKVAERYDGKYYMFDVVNESNYCATRSPNFPLYDGDALNYVRWSLETAGELFSKNCILERNEGTSVNYGQVAEEYYNQNKQLIDEGVRLDAIGYQFHMYTGKSCIENHLCGEANLTDMYRAYKQMSTLGVPMYITEVTIPTVYENMPLEQGEELQAEIIEKLYRLWFSVPNMQGIVYWNIKDGDAWKNEVYCLGCLIDRYMRKKKSYYAIEHLIKREWNTCMTQEFDGGNLEFSGFYGDYDITVEVNGATVKKQRVSLLKDTDTIIITL